MRPPAGSPAPGSPARQLSQCMPASHLRPRDQRGGVHFAFSPHPRHPLHAMPSRTRPPWCPPLSPSLGPRPQTAAWWLRPAPVGVSRCTRAVTAVMWAPSARRRPPPPRVARTRPPMRCRRCGSHRRRGERWGGGRGGAGAGAWGRWGRSNESLGRGLSTCASTPPSPGRRSHQLLISTATLGGHVSVHRCPLEAALATAAAGRVVQTWEETVRLQTIGDLQAMVGAGERWVGGRSAVLVLPWDHGEDWEEDCLRR